MAKIIQHLEESKGETIFSLEILPPVKGQGITELFSAIEPLMEVKPKFVDAHFL